MGQPLADCDFNLAALHPAYPIKRRTSAQRTQAPESVDTRRASALDPLENAIRRFEPSGVRKKRPFTDGVAHGSSRPKTDLGLFLPLTRGGWRAGRQRSLARDRAGPGLLRHPVTLGGPKPPTSVTFEVVLQPCAAHACSAQT